MGKKIFTEKGQEEIRRFAQEMSRCWINERYMDEYRLKDHKKLFRNTPVGQLIENISKFDFIEDQIMEYTSQESVSQKNGSFNIYPFGIKTNNVYQQWLGIYHENDKMTGLQRLLTKGIEHCRAKNTDGTKEKDIIILTDIWTNKIEEEIVTAFLPYYTQGSCSVRVLLFNNYGITAVPFFMTYIWEQLIQNVEICNMQPDQVAEECKKKLLSEHIIYQSVSWTIFNRIGKKNEEVKECEIDLAKGYFKNENGKKFKLERAAINLFVRKIVMLRKQIRAWKAPRELTDSRLVCIDEQHYKKVHILDKEISWRPELPMGKIEKELKKAFQNLLGVEW
jgi:hypothetical protein